MTPNFDYVGTRRNRVRLSCRNICAAPRWKECAAGRPEGVTGREVVSADEVERWEGNAGKEESCAQQHFSCCTPVAN